VDLLIATTNKGKLSEILSILEGLPIAIDSLDRYPNVQEPEEIGHTFAANARLKAAYYGLCTKRLSVSEDSGLEIDALNGAPGVISARFNGNSYPKKFTSIYQQLRQQSSKSRTARFVCALALADCDRIIFEATGTIEGEITDSPRGEQGFGYDPIFYYPPANCTLAEMTSLEKTIVSHRGKAFRQLRYFIETRTNLRSQRIP
jgi:XTP/dITP diphosphohydrolase